ncbi:MAG TPA: hypothetical protein VK601_08675 [Kofleriaceae bacterium]|nr:hypothetical protein [Kofleriaceae bacterium]
MTTPATIDAAWGAARAGQWTAWPGLPPGLPVASVVAALTGAAPPLAVASRLGRRQVERHDAPPLHVWSDRGAAILVEWLDPPCSGAVAELLAALGPPQREAAGRHLRAGATTTEYVYAGRGLALTVAASYDQPPSFAPYLATVQLFAPGSLRDFVLELGGNDQPGPRPIGPGPR